MSQKKYNFDQLLKDEINKPVTIINKRKNNLFQSNKIKIPLYNNPLYIKTEMNQIEGKNYSTQYDNNIIEINSHHNYPTQIDFLSNNNSQKNIYIKKNIIISPHRCNSNSDKEFNKIFLSKFSSTQRAFSNSRNNNKKGLMDYKDYKIIEECDSNSTQNIININLIKEKNNYIENNIINKIYINKNKKNKRYVKSSQSNSSINNINKINEEQVNMNLTERNSFQRRNNYIYHYFANNDSNKNKITYKRKEPNTVRNSINNKKPNNESNNVKCNYKESDIIKIQSVVRGYLLNKHLDKILRNYIIIKEANTIIKRFYKKKIFQIIKQKQSKKRYNHQNVYYCKKRNYSQNKIINKDKKDDNFHLQYKINELIKEKNELQTNYQNLKEFMNKYKQLITEKAEMLQEIEKLRQINNKLIKTQKQNLIYNKNKKTFLIQKQNNFIITNNKKMVLIKEENKSKESKNYQILNPFLTLGKDNKDNNESIRNDKNDLKICKLKYLVKNKEDKLKIILGKYFYKFYYFSIINNKNKIDNKPKINVINRRYNNAYNAFNNYENQNNNLPHISIKTLSDNSSVFNDAKGRNLSIITGLNNTEEDNKKNKFFFN